MTQEDRKELDKAAKSFNNGNKKAFAVIYDKSSDPVFRVCLNIIGNYHQAEDTMQDVFTKVLESIHAFRGDSSFFTWIYRIAINTSLSNISRKKEKVLRDDATFPELTVEPDEKDFEKKLDIELLRKCISELDPEFKSIIILRDIEQLAYRDIAEIEKIPVGTVRSRLYRARTALKEHFFVKRGGHEV